MLTKQNHKSIKIATPYGLQRIVFDDLSIVTNHIANHDIVLIVIDERIHKLDELKAFISSIESNRQIHVLPIAINNYTKNTELLFSVFDEMNRLGMTRKSLLISIGGGATSDLVGVAAAFYMRGIEYVVIPTSFISMADTVISKVAVNHGETKNMIGAFRSPALTYIDLAFTKTIDETNLAYGLVEILKQALLEHDMKRVKQILGLLSSDTIDIAGLKELVSWSLKKKSKYVAPDWYDVKGKHKALSLGHTLANYLEMKGEYHHAVAVLYGMVLEYLIAQQRGIVAPAECKVFFAAAQLFEERFKQHEQVMIHLQPSVLIPALRKDKISHHGTIRFVLPTKRGYCVSVVSEDELADAVEAFGKLKFS